VGDVAERVVRGGRRLVGDARQLSQVVPQEHDVAPGVTGQRLVGLTAGGDGGERPRRPGRVARRGRRQPAGIVVARIAAGPVAPAVPVIAPVPPLRARPAGRLPSAIVQPYGAVPEFAVSPLEYGALVLAFGSEPVTI